MDINSDYLRDDMDSTTDPADLDQRMGQLADDDRRAVRLHWEQVVREELVPAPERVPRTVSLAELEERKERRQARRAMALVVRLASLPTSAEPVAYGPEAA